MGKILVLHFHGVLGHVEKEKVILALLYQTWNSSGRDMNKGRRNSCTGTMPHTFQGGSLGQRMIWTHDASRQSLAMIKSGKHRSNGWKYSEGLQGRLKGAELPMPVKTRIDIFSGYIWVRLWSRWHPLDSHQTKMGYSASHARSIFHYAQTP